MSRSQRAPRDVAATAVAITTPTLAVGAHALSSGVAPNSAAILLVAGSGLAAGAIARGIRSVLAMAVLLAAAALVNHLLLSVASQGPMAAMGHGSDVSMLGLHALAIPLCALLIVAADRLYDIATAVLIALGRLRLPAPTGLVRTPIESVIPTLTGRNLVGGSGLRGPPLPQ